MYYLSLAALAAASPVVQRLSYGNPLGLKSRDISASQLESHTQYWGGGQEWYYCDLTIGSNQAVVRGVLDTGSYTLNVDDSVYDPSASDTMVNQSLSFQSCYTTGCVTGYYLNDNVVTDGGLNATQMRFSYAPIASSLGKVLGMAPQTLEEDNNSSLINQLYRNGQIESRSFSMWLAGYTEGGQVVFGGVDHAKYKGTLALVPMQLDSAGNPSANTYVRKVYAYNQCGDRALVYEGVTELGFDSGNPSGYTPPVLNSALRAAWNSTLASTQPDALAAGFSADDYVVQYQGGGGFTLDICGVELSIDMVNFVTDPNGVRIKDPEVGGWYCDGLRSADETTFELGIPTFFNNVYYVADWDLKQLAFAQVAPASEALSSSTVEAIGTGGVPSATTAPYYSDTVIASATTYSTNLYKTTCTASSSSSVFE